MELKEQQMLMQVLTELVRSWSENLTLEELWHDNDKMCLLLNAREMLHNDVLVPHEVRAYYDDVFERPIWG